MRRLQWSTIFAFALVIRTFGQTDINYLKSELIGSWEFSELRDKDGNPVDTIWHGQGWELAAGPKLTYRDDGTYIKQFTPQNSDNGTWYFDADKNIIVHHLYYSKPYSFAAQYLIDNGHAKQDSTGAYYEVVTDKVVELTAEKLILLEREDRRRSFVKKTP